MEFIRWVIDVALHIDVHLGEIILQYGAWTYGILFLIIFSETGLVVTPFLPGDSLLFAAGALSATTALSPVWLTLLLSLAAIVGNMTNYWIGYAVGPRIVQKKNMRFINREYLDRTHKFYEKYGGMTIVVARFLPIIRTFAPFVAGVGFMAYGRFMLYSVAAGFLWVGLFIGAGYYFGNLPAVKENFSLVIAGIIVVSMLPGVIEFLRRRKRAPQE
jgi:membrane-associated protein